MTALGVKANVGSGGTSGVFPRLKLLILAMLPERDRDRRVGVSCCGSLLSGPFFRFSSSRKTSKRRGVEILLPRKVRYRELD